MAFVVSQGQLSALSRPDFDVRSRIAVTSDYSADYAKIWESHGSVQTVTNFLGRNIASLGIHLFQHVGETDRKRNRDHQVAKLMQRPHPRVTRYTFFDTMVRDVAIFERYLAVKLKLQDGTPGGLERIAPTMFTPVGGDWLHPEAFEIRGSKGKKIVKAEDCFYILGYSPDGKVGGVSPIESLRAVLAEEYEAARQRSQAFRNGARVNGYIERPKEAGDWSDKARERFRAGWRGQYGGGGSDAYGTPILEDGMKFVSAGQSAKDLQYIESRKLTREEVASAYFIPPPMVGILDHATFSNVKEQHKHLYQDTLGPWLQRIQQELMLQLFADFPDTDDLYLEFNLAEKMRGSFEEQAAQLQAAVGGPYMTRNEGRAMNNLPAIEGGDELIVPLNVLVGGQASPQDSGSQNLASGPGRQVKSAEFEIKAPEEVPEDHQEAMAEVFSKFFARQRKAVLSAAGAKAPDWWDAERWDKELAADILAASLKVTEETALAAIEAMGEDPSAYSVEQTEAFLAKVAERIAAQVNATTLTALEVAQADEEQDLAHVFDVAEESRAAKSGMTAAATFVGFAMVEAAQQARPQAKKRWKTNSGNSRSSHKRINGETVPIDEKFSNGLKWPGSFSGDVDEVANCKCSVVIVT
ncbi:portal protein [Arthrobacter phage MargaretKali]|uniref:Portal and MuF-like fusion protein n=1 Tax=Arthrobacter phage MargaretKali TaxID=2250414 RepID=A0A345KN53_9CAUD|nr:portal protein [Arthrobacter phage MargaretKali]AXH44455.1 portal and MuF-like fusion protein [Arthrobacter phage MargaretKali]